VSRASSAAAVDTTGIYNNSPDYLPVAFASTGSTSQIAIDVGGMSYNPLNEILSVTKVSANTMSVSDSIAAGSNDTTVPTTAWVTSKINSSGGGTITGVTAGTGLTGGASSGNATLGLNISTITSGYTKLSTTTVVRFWITRIANSLCILNVTFKTSSNSTGAIITLPSGYRPNRQVDGFCVGNEDSGNSIVTGFYISTNGGIYKQGAYGWDGWDTDGSYYSINMTYPIS